MPLFSIAGMNPVNIVICASTEKEAVELAREGKGYIEECLGMDIEIEDKPSVSNLDE